MEVVDIKEKWTSGQAEDASPDAQSKPKRKPKSKPKSKE